MRWREIPLTAERREMIGIAAKAAVQHRDGSQIVKFVLPKRLVPSLSIPSDPDQDVPLDVGEIVLRDDKVRRADRFGWDDLHRIRYGEEVLWTDGWRAFVPAGCGA